MKKEIKERIKEQVKKLSREELENRYLKLLFESIKEKDKAKARLMGTLGSMISQNKKQQSKAAPTLREQYHRQLEHPLWLKKRSIILERDNHQCVMCGSKFSLQVHHLRYSEGKKAWEYPNSALVTLCDECHQKVHSDPNHELNPYRDKG